MYAGFAGSAPTIGGLWISIGYEGDSIHKWAGKTEADVYAPRGFPFFPMEGSGFIPIWFFLREF